MKIKNLLLTVFFGMSSAHAADLLEVYQQAQTCDAVFHQQMAERLSTKEGVPISVAALLPNITLQVSPSVTRYWYAGTDYTTIIPLLGTQTIEPRNVTTRAYTLNLNLNQTIFDFAKFSTVASQVALSHEADATLNLQLQNLMIRVASAYFAVLQDEENLSANEASKIFNAENLDQVKQQYDVGLKTITDVYTAQAAYDTARAQYIAAQTTLANDRENLRVITGKYYPHLSALSNHFPLISPRPADVEEWVSTALRQNWSIKASQYQVNSNLQLIRQQFAGHLPTITMQGSYTKQYANNVNSYNSLQQRNGPGTTSDKSLAFNIDVPIFEGGGVVAATNQAVYNYQAAQQQLEQAVRNTVNATRQNYLNVVSGISKVQADREAIKSNISSLEGLQAQYRVGTETLVDVLNQQRLLLQAQLAYATDRYSFVNSVLALKQAAGTLSFNDLRAINVWLVTESQSVVISKSIDGITYHYPNLVSRKTQTVVAMKHKVAKHKIIATKTHRQLPSNLSSRNLSAKLHGRQLTKLSMSHGQAAGKRALLKKNS